MNRRIAISICIFLAAGTVFFLLPQREQRELKIGVIAKPTEQRSFPQKETESGEEKNEGQKKEGVVASRENAAEKLQTIQTAIDALKMSLKTFSESQPAPIEQKPRLSQAELYRIAAQSVVNLLCQEDGGTITVATGAIIHPAGYILTNAHIGDNANKEQECTARTGSPATPFAIAKLIFSPSAFAATTSITEQIKWDAALWKIEKPSLGASSLPESFDALTIDILHEFSSQEALATFSYPAELLSKEVILSSLYLVFSETAVEGVDEFFIQSLAGLGSQQGSSGGALLDPATGKFVGLIFAIDKETEINKRRLFALRASRIDEIMKIETGKTLAEYLATQS